jgi:hypothetical protein
VLKINKDSRFFAGLGELEMDNRIRPLLDRYASAKRELGRDYPDPDAIGNGGRSALSVWYEGEAKSRQRVASERRPLLLITARGKTRRASRHIGTGRRTSDAGLSCRTPSNTTWRSRLSSVHPRKLTSITISGLTQ